MLMYKYFNVDERCKFLLIMLQSQKVFSERVVALKAFKVNWFHVTYLPANLMIEYSGMASQRK